MPDHEATLHFFFNYLFFWLRRRVGRGRGVVSFECMRAESNNLTMAALIHPDWTREETHVNVSPAMITRSLAGSKKTASPLSAPCLPTPAPPSPPETGYHLPLFCSFYRFPPQLRRN